MTNKYTRMKNYLCPYPRIAAKLTGEKSRNEEASNNKVRKVNRLTTFSTITRK